MAQLATAPKNGVQTKPAPAAQPSNGQQAKTESPTPGTPALESKTALPATPNVQTPGQAEEKKEAPAKPVPSIEEVLQKIKDRSDIAFKLDKLRETRANLEGFILRADGHRQNITFEDEAGQDFTTYYTPLLEQVQEHIRTWLGVQISAIEEELIATA